MKVSRTTWWILTIGIFAILLITAGVTYNRNRAEQSQLTQQIAQVNQEYVTYLAQKDDVDARLAQANSQLLSAKGEFAKSAESIETSATLFELAEESNVTITSLTCSLPEEEEVNGIVYRVLSLNITAETAVLPALLNFTSKVSDAFTSSDISSVSVVITPAELVEEEEEGGIVERSEEKATIDLAVTIYVYEGE